MFQTHCFLITELPSSRQLAFIYFKVVHVLNKHKIFKNSISHHTTLSQRTQWSLLTATAARHVMPPPSSQTVFLLWLK